MEGSGHSTLRAKYLDWCSARLAERFLDLSPEEIYALARPDEAGPQESATGDVPPDAPSSAVPSDAPSVSETTEAAPMEPGGAPAPETAPGPRLPHPTDDGYRVLVQRVTEALLKRTSLPTFEQWSEAYAEDPDRFDAELLGFWKDVVGEVGEDE